MLKRLRIENIAIIESVDIEIGPGLNVITGETGAGKSILIASLELALGERASADMIRTGEKLAVVEAAFEGDIPDHARRIIVDELGLEWEPGEALTLRREISAAGRNRCLVAGQQVGVADLKRLGEALADLSGQHEHQSLLRPKGQRAALDAHGDYGDLMTQCAGLYHGYAALRRRRDELAQQASDHERRLDFLQFQIGELEQVRPEAGELERLAAEEARLSSVEARARASAHAYALLYEGDGEETRAVETTLGEIRRDLDHLARLDPGAAKHAQALEEIRALVGDLSAELRDYAAECEANPGRLDEVIQRVEAIRKLMRKHGAKSDAELVDTMVKLMAERDRVELDETERVEIDQKLEAAAVELRARCEKLRLARAATAKKLEVAVMKTLAQVGMEKAVFKIEVTAEAEPGPDGMDRIDFLLAANPGEGARPLREVASGGELSRAMLALKTALAERDAIPLLVFDEIDAGVSGETAARVGKLLEKLGASHQTICITHHASIAARANHHLTVRKTAAKGRTTSAALSVSGEERVDEIARLIGGADAGDDGRKVARKLMA